MRRTEKKNEDKAEEAKTEPNDSSRRSDHKVSGVSFATNAAWPRKVKCQRRQQRKSVKRITSGKDPDMRELTVSQESDFSEPLSVSI